MQDTHVFLEAAQLVNQLNAQMNLIKQFAFILPQQMINEKFKLK